MNIPGISGITELRRKFTITTLSLDEDLVPNAVSTSLCGWLHKQSKDKYNIFLQKRYFVISHDSETGNHYLEYYKKKSDVGKVFNDLYKINFDTIVWVRPFDKSHDCKRFELQAKNRVYLFEATSYAEMNVWIGSMKLVLTEREERNRQIVSKLVKLFDSSEPTAYQSQILQDLQSRMYGTSDMCLSQILSHATNLGLEKNVAKLNQISDYIRNEVELALLPSKRYDIMVVTINAIQSFLNQLMAPLLSEHSPAYLAANLSELHSAIKWLNAVQSQINDLYFGPSLLPEPFTLSERLPDMCLRYANGSSKNTTSAVVLEGALHHMAQSCRNIVESFLSDPVTMLHKNSTTHKFYTDNPVDIWQLWNDHIDLANDTNCPFLQVLIINKMKDTLCVSIAVLTDFINKFDNLPATVKSNKIEFLCAFLNDCVFHFEHICACISSFDEDIRWTIDDIFKDVILKIVQFGQRCIHMLIDLTMADVALLMAKLLTPAWWDDNILQTIIATVKDYCDDYERYLVKFWLEKLAIHLLEMIVLKYAHTLLYRNYKVDRTVKSKGKEQAVYSFRFVSLKQEITIDSEKAASIAKDVSYFNAFLSNHSIIPLDKTRIILALMNDVLDYLQSNPLEIQNLAKQRMVEYPVYAQAVYETGAACIRLRSDLPIDTLKTFTTSLQPLISELSNKTPLTTSRSVSSSETDFENDLGQMYRRLFALVIQANIPPKSRIASPSSTSSASLDESRDTSVEFGLDKRADDAIYSMTYLPLEALKRAYQRVIEDEDGNGEGRRTMSQLVRLHRKSKESSSQLTAGLKIYNPLSQSNQRDVQSTLVAQVKTIVTNQTELHMKQRADKESRAEAAKQEEMRLLGTKLFFESSLEKCKPGSQIIWQKRYFKLTSRPKINCLSDECPFDYVLIWSGWRGGGMRGSLEVKDIESIVLVYNPNVIIQKSYRPLVYDQNHKKLLLQSQAPANYKQDGMVDVVMKDFNLSNTDMYSQHYLFMVKLNKKVVSKGTTLDLQERYFRTTTVDKLIGWINCLSLAASLSYNPSPDVRAWTKQVKIDTGTVTPSSSRKNVPVDDLKQPEWLKSMEQILHLSEMARASFSDTTGTLRMHSTYQEIPRFKSLADSDDEEECLVDSAGQAKKNTELSDDDDESVSSGTSKSEDVEEDSENKSINLYNSSTTTLHSSSQSTLTNAKNDKDSVVDRSKKKTILSSQAVVTLEPPEAVRGWLKKRARSITGFGYQWLQRFCRIDLKSKSLFTSPDTSETTVGPHKKLIPFKFILEIRKLKEFGTDSVFVIDSEVVSLQQNAVNKRKIHVFSAASDPDAEKWLRILNEWKIYFTHSA